MPVAIPKPTDEEKRIGLMGFYSLLCNLESDNSNTVSVLAYLECTGISQNIVGGIKMSEHLKALKDMHTHERLLRSLLEDCLSEVDRCLARSV